MVEEVDVKPLMKKEEPSDDSEDEDEERPQVEFYRKYFLQKYPTIVALNSHEFEKKLQLNFTQGLNVMENFGDQILHISLPLFTIPL